MSWSYSSLSLFKQCPRKYYRLRISKDIVEPVAEHLIYGNAVHKAAEEYGRSGIEIPEKYKYIQPHVDLLLEMPGTKYFEHQMGLRKDRSACDFYDAEVWWRGIADLMVVPEDSKRAFIIDYKTSKSARYADTDQLEILGLALFAHFPKIEKIRAGLLFLVSEEFITVEIDRNDIPKLWEKWDVPTKRLEMAHESGVWNPSPNFTCRKWCPVLDCEHNGRI